MYFPLIMLLSFPKNAHMLMDKKLKANTTEAQKFLRFHSLNWTKILIAHFFSYKSLLFKIPSISAKYWNDFHNLFYNLFIISIFLVIICNLFFTYYRGKSEVERYVFVLFIILKTITVPFVIFRIQNQEKCFIL